MKPYAKKLLGDSLPSDTDCSDTDWSQSSDFTDSSRDDQCYKYGFLLL